ncbi:MAG: hypothetical protein WCT08_01330 [Patescibacteria group bacterium]|jgi:hypothetical protein
MEVTKKDSFFKVYANLPIGLRDEVILVIPNIGPITWNAAYNEISNDTELGKTLLLRLQELKFI